MSCLEQLLSHRLPHIADAEATDAHSDLLTFAWAAPISLSACVRLDHIATWIVNS
jgi:hypothetical protein